MEEEMTTEKFEKLIENAIQEAIDQAQMPFKVANVMAVGIRAAGVTAGVFEGRGNALQVNVVLTSE